mmetsp:Transcript_23224/g.57309  ORF Transcript_23224/g.57309 Transcript_23224/m.57309 type:complete len:255 (+) Transcript_23224:464-1228(+)
MAHSCLDPCPRLLRAVIAVGGVTLPRLVQDQLPELAQHQRQVEVPGLHVSPRRNGLANLHGHVVAVKLTGTLEDLLHREKLPLQPVEQSRGLVGQTAQGRLEVLHEVLLDVGDVGVLIQKRRLRVVVERPPVELGSLGSLPEPVYSVLQGWHEAPVLGDGAASIGLLHAHLPSLGVLPALVVEVNKFLWHVRESQEFDQILLSSPGLAQQWQPPEKRPQEPAVWVLDDGTVHAVDSRLGKLPPDRETVQPLVGE